MRDHFAWDNTDELMMFLRLSIKTQCYFMINNMGLHDEQNITLIT